MKKRELYFVLLFSIIFNSALFGQDYFKNTWIGFKSGEYTNGKFPHTAETGDLNNDGFNDIVIGQFALDPGFKVVFSNGDGTYSLPVHYPTVRGMEDVKIADFNNDGYNDIVVANSGTFAGSWGYGNSVSVFLNNGSGAFPAGNEIITALHPRGMAVSDFNNDGIIDIAVANFGRPATPGNTISILINNGSANFTVQNITVGNFPFWLAAGKYNNDNLPDLVIGHESSERTVLINNGSGFNPPAPFPGIRPSGYTLGHRMDMKDMDNDGDDDLVFFNSWGSSDYINIYRNNGGNFSGFEAYMYPSYLGSGIRCSYSDLNNDGWPDIVSASFNGMSGKGFFVFKSNGTGGFMPAKVFSSGMASSAVFCDDINSDGNNDVVVVDFSMSVNVHMNNGDAEFPENPIYEVTGGQAEDIDKGDIDLDGDLDIITSTDDGSETDISVLKNNGDGTFAPHFTITRTGSDQGGAHAKLRDVNGDNYPDVIFLSPVTNLSYTTFVAFNNGSGGFGVPVDLQVYSCGWGDIEAVDLDNDNDLDMVMTEFLACVSIPESGKRIFVLINNGNGTFQNPLIKVIGSNPRTMAEGDFNRDGRMDIVTAHFGPYGYRNFIQILIGDGTGNFAEPVTKLVGYGPHHIITSDLNNDGILDIASANTGTDGIGIETMSILIGNNDGSFQNAVTYDAPYSSDLLGTSGIAASDVDADGDRDILVVNTAGGDLALYINDGSGSFEHLYRVGVTGNGPRGISAADFTGDNIEDLAVISAPALGFLVINHVSILEGKGGIVPVELASFDAVLQGNNVILTWSTSSETNNSHFIVEKSFNLTEFNYLGTVKGNGTTTERNIYTYEDNTAGKEKIYYRLKQIDFDGSFTYSTIIEIDAGLNLKYELSQNYPNPFNPSTTFEYSIPDNGFVTLKIFDILGREITTLVNENKLRGKYNVIFNADGLAAGTYFYGLRVNDYYSIKKMVLLK